MSLLRSDQVESDMYMKKTFVYVTLAAFFSSLAAFLQIDGSSRTAEYTHANMVASAQQFLKELNADMFDRATYPFESDERFNWHYIPRSRRGVPIKVMTEKQREAAFALLQSALSDQGYEKATGIIQLEAVLRELEGRGSGDTYRDPELYYFTIFGTPSTAAPWGWRVEGHHLSLNFSSATEELVVATPAFMGANPAEVPEGPLKGWRVLEEEEVLARDLLNALDPSQRSMASISKSAPSDIITGASREVRIGRPEGLSASEMTDTQKAQLMHLVKVYIHSNGVRAANAHLEKIEQAEVEKLHFAWAGDADPGRGHYYRIHGPTLLIEYDNTRSNANHIHTVVRDLENDFGEDILRTHYEQSEHQ